MPLIDRIGLFFLAYLFILLNAECDLTTPLLTDAQKTLYLRSLSKCSYLSHVDPPSEKTTLAVSKCEFRKYLDELHSTNSEKIKKLAFLNKVKKEERFLSLCNVVYGASELKDEMQFLNKLFNKVEAGHVETDVADLVHLVAESCKLDCHRCPESLCVEQESCAFNKVHGCFSTSGPTESPTTDGLLNNLNNPSPTPPQVYKGFNQPALHPSTPELEKLDAVVVQTNAEPVTPTDSSKKLIVDYTTLFLIASSITWCGMVIYLIRSRDCKWCSSGINRCQVHLEKNMEGVLPYPGRPKEGEVSEGEVSQMEGVVKPVVAQSQKKRRFWPQRGMSWGSNESNVTFVGDQLAEYLTEEDSIQEEAAPDFLIRVGESEKDANAPVYSPRSNPLQDESPPPDPSVPVQSSKCVPSEENVHNLLRQANENASNFRSDGASRVQSEDYSVEEMGYIKGMKSSSEVSTDEESMGQYASYWSQKQTAEEG